MCTSRWFTLLVLGMAAVLIPGEVLLAQGKGRPPFPPGLHDRTLPPGKPFDGGGFDPPGRGRGNVTLSAADAEELARYLSDPAFAASHSLSDAVAAFNRWVQELPAAQLATPPESFARAFLLLRHHLGMDTATDDPAIRRIVEAGSITYAVLGDITTGTSASADRAQDQDALRRRYLLPLPGTGLDEGRRWMLPGMAAATPTGFGAEFGLVWAAASYQPKVRYNDGDDGAVALGFGLGNAHRWVGLQVGINSFSTVNSGFGDRVGVDLHLHRTFGGIYGVAVGWESVRGSWDVTRDSGENVYVVGSRWLQFRSDPYADFGVGMVSLGIGTGRFQTETPFHEDRGGVGIFGSFGVRLAPPVTFIAEWTGQDLMLATSVTPLRDQRMAITAGFTELTGAAGDGPRFAVGGSYGFDFKNR